MKGRLLSLDKHYDRQMVCLIKSNFRHMGESDSDRCLIRLNEYVHPLKARRVQASLEYYAEG